MEICESNDDFNGGFCCQSSQLDIARRFITLHEQSSEDLKVGKGAFEGFLS
jgi:hypothetical protein